VTTLASLVVFTADVDAMIAFYGAIGIPLEGEDHGDRHVHAATDVGGVHVAVFPAEYGTGKAPGRREAGSTFAGWYVDSLDATGAALTALGTPVLSGHEAMAWGCRVVVIDPDGRAVEINQEGHCTT
jgi:predicted enzyme related to lactoylglutathione lyase